MRLLLLLSFSLLLNYGEGIECSVADNVCKAEQGIFPSCIAIIPLNDYVYAHEPETITTVKKSNQFTYYNAMIPEHGCWPLTHDYYMAKMKYEGFACHHYLQEDKKEQKCGFGSIIDSTEQKLDLFMCCCNNKDLCDNDVLPDIFNKMFSKNPDKLIDLMKLPVPHVTKTTCPPERQCPILKPCPGPPAQKPIAGWITFGGGNDTSPYDPMPTVACYYHWILILTLALLVVLTLLCVVCFGYVRTFVVVHYTTEGETDVEGNNTGVDEEGKKEANEDEKELADSKIV